VRPVREREAKLTAEPGFDLPDLSPAIHGMSCRPLPPRDLDALYYDTRDLRLALWGITVRHRTGEGQSEGWTVKLPDGDDGPALVRRELAFPGEATTVPSEVSAMVVAYTRSEPLIPVARLHTRRKGVELLDGEGRRAAEVVDDEVSVHDGDAAAGRRGQNAAAGLRDQNAAAGRRGQNAALTAFRELEVELGPEAPADLLPSVVAALTRAGAETGDQLPKLVRALGPRASGPPELVMGEVSGRSTVAEVVRNAMVASTTRIIRHDPGVRIGDDAEEVHQARVGARRLRSDLQTFRTMLDPEWVEVVRSELRWLGGVLGAVRDADVLLERLRRHTELLPESDAPGVAALVRRLAEQREAARAALLEALSCDRYIRLLDVLVDGSTSPPTRPDAEAAAAEALPALAARPWRKLKRAVAELPDDPPDDALHAVRIRAKRCRYAAEAVAPVIGRPARRFAAAVADLQTVLGDHQDAVVAEGWLRRAAAAGAVPELVAGQLITLQRTEAEASRQACRPAWKRAADKRLRRWLP